VFDGHLAREIAPHEQRSEELDALERFRVDGGPRAALFGAQTPLRPSTAAVEAGSSACLLCKLGSGCDERGNGRLSLKMTPTAIRSLSASGMGLPNATKSPVHFLQEVQRRLAVCVAKSG